MPPAKKRAPDRRSGSAPYAAHGGSSAAGRRSSSSIAANAKRKPSKAVQRGTVPPRGATKQKHTVPVRVILWLCIPLKPSAQIILTFRAALTGSAGSAAAHRASSRPASIKPWTFYSPAEEQDEAGADDTEQQETVEAEQEEQVDDGRGDGRCSGACRLGWPLKRGACGNAWCNESKHAVFGCITCKIRICNKPECLNNHLFGWGLPDQAAW